MSELVLPFAIMALTVAVLVAVLSIFRKWGRHRDRYWAEDMAGARRSGHAAAE